MPDFSSEPFEIAAGGVTVSGEASPGEPALVLLHGLSATRRYVVMGSTLLQREGLGVIAYDARGHGLSSPAPAPDAYTYEAMRADLAALLDERGMKRAILVGNSMGAATSTGFALEHPDRVAAMVLVTPAYGGRPSEGADLDEWDALADGLAQGGVEGFLAAYHPQVEDRFRETVMTFTRQRLERHRHPGAVADALKSIPRSAAFDGLERLAEIDVPTLVVGSRDAADPGHPLSVAREYAERMPDAELLLEEEGKSPLAWQGAQLSREILAFLKRRDLR